MSELSFILKLLDMGTKFAWDEMEEKEQKSITFFVLNRFLSNVKGTKQEQEHYVFFTNELLNKHFFNLYKHPKLQWLLGCMITYDKKVKYHEWIAHKKVSDKRNSRIKFLEKLYPMYKNDELELLLKLNSDKELKKLATEYGYDDKQIKEIFK